MRYYINGKQVNATQARNCAEAGYIGQGGDPAEFAAVWELRDCEFSGEEQRELLNEWSGYTLEILTDEEDDALDD